MLQGKTRIELTDVKTGKKEVVEKHNMVTDAMQKIFNGLNAHLNHPLDTSSARLYDVLTANMPIYQKVFGGIMLFDDVLTESANTIFQDGGVNVVGTAGAGYSGSDSWRGTLNSAESGIVYSDTTPIGYRFVWDFGTDKANGTIKAAALTSAAAGAGGCPGIASATLAQANASMSSVFGNMHAIFNHIFEGSDYTQRVLVVSGNDVFYLGQNGKDLYKISAFDPSEVHLLEEHSRFSAPALIKTFAHSMRYANVMPNGNLSEPVAEAGQFTTHVVSVSDWSETTVTTPFTDAAQYAMAAFYYDGAKLYIVDGNGVKILNATTGDTIYSTTGFSLSGARSDYVFKVGNYVVFCSSTATDSSYGAAIAIDMSDNSVSYVNAIASHKNSNYWYYRQISCSDIQPPYVLIEYDYDFYTGKDYKTISSLKLNPYILTVQNLSSPGVTKTPAQTMKITYEITESA